jgi:photosystem II stability/assembly factor-like uncharacterized protein
VRAPAPQPATAFSRASRAWGALALAALLAATSALAALPASSAGATSTSVVGATVPASTELDVSGCQSGQADRTDLGLVTPGVGVVSSLDCAVLFGSSNATSTLQTYRSSMRPTAMSMPPTSITETTAQFRVMDFDMATATVGWVAHDSSAATLRKTTDGGVNWSAPPAQPWAGGSGARAVSAPSANVAWAARRSTNEVRLTTDGGSNWTNVSLPATARGLAIWAADATNAWVAGELGADAKVWRTVNGGSNWTEVYHDAGGSTITDISFASGTGWFTRQDGRIFKTTDGTNWSQSTALGTYKYAIEAIDANRAIAVGSYGQILRTSNGGTNWSWGSSGTAITLRDVSYLGSGVAWAAGEHGTILRSTNHGADWSVRPSAVEGTSLQGLEAIDDDTLVMASPGSVYARSTDAASTWSPATTPAIGGNWASVGAADAAHLWRVGTAGRIEATTDGSTWNPQSSGTTQALRAVEVVSRSIVIAVGSGGTIRRTTDGGATWSTVPSGTTSALRDVTSTADGRVWVVGDGGTVLRSNDNGASFTTVTSGTTVMATAVTAFSSADVIVGLADGQLRRTTDQGASWTVIGTAPSDVAVTSLDADPGGTRIVGSFGTSTMTSANSGSTWSSGVIGTSLFVHDVSLADGSTAFAATQLSRLYRSTNGGATWTLLTGGGGVRSLYATTALGPDSAYAVGESNTTAVTNATTNVPDYNGAGNSWTGSGHFGICLYSATGAASSWPTTGSCPANNGTNWRAVPSSGGDPAAAAASTSGAGNLTANFRFGLKAPTSQAPGAYRAPIEFTVVAPAT